MRDSIPEEKITEIRERASIVEVISDFVSLKKSGKNYVIQTGGGTNSDLTASTPTQQSQLI